MTVQNPPTARKLVRAGLPVSLAALSVVAGILALYMGLPVPTGNDPQWFVWVSIATMSAVYVTAGVWAVFRIQRSKHPARAGAVALAVMVTAVVVMFALAYVTMSVGDPESFNVPLDKISALYFTMTVLTTVGFGDIHAVSHSAMIAVMVQMVISLTLVTTFARILLAASRSAAKRRYAELSELTEPE